MYMYLISDAVKTMHSNTCKYMYRNYRITEKCEKPKLWNIFSTQQ